MKRQAWIVAAGTGLLLAVTALFLGRLQHVQRLGTPGLKVVAEPILDDAGAVAATNSVYLPPTVLDYRSEPQPVTRIELEWLPPDTLFGRRLYTAPDDFGSLLSVVLMGSDRTSIHKPEYCLYGQAWRIDSTEAIEIPVTRPVPYSLRAVKLTTSRTDKGPDGRELPWRGVYIYWFIADRQQTGDHVERMWWMARDLVLRGVLQRWAYVTCFSVCSPGQEAATFDRMKRFIAEAVPHFHLHPAPGPSASLGQD